MNTPAGDSGPVRPILVGVDGSASAITAARWAAREAAVRQAPVRLVNAFGWMPVHDQDDPLQVVPEARDDLLRAARERLAVAAARVAEVTPAQLVVVGSRGRGGLAGMTLGSVSQALLHHAGCPVTVVR